MSSAIFSQSRSAGAVTLSSSLVRRLAPSAITCLLLLLNTHAVAEGYPTRPVRLIVPFPPGGATEILARTLAPHLNEAFGQPIVIDNRAGAGGTIGTAIAARAKPDGYTLVLGTIGSVAMSAGLYSNLAYDSRKDLAAITNLVSQPIALVGHPTVGPKTVAELVDRAKASPHAVVYASTGVGGAMHLAGELLQVQAGVRFVHVPYKGGGPVISALLGQEVPVAFVGLAPALPHVKSGRLRAVAVASHGRSPVLPNVPTIGESVSGFQVNYWTGLLAPNRTPNEIVTKLADEAIRTFRSAEVKTRLEAAGFEVIASTPAEFSTAIDHEWSRWNRVIRTAGIKPE